MRMLIVLAAAVAVSGCGTISGLLRSDDRPQPKRLLEQSKVDDTHRTPLHSLEPNSPY